MPSTGRPFFSAVSMRLPAWSATHRCTPVTCTISASGGSAVWRRVFLKLVLAALGGAEAQRQHPSALPRRRLRTSPGKCRATVSRKNVGGTRAVHGVGLLSRLR